MALLDPDRCVVPGYTEAAGVASAIRRPKRMSRANRDRQLALGRGADLRAAGKAAAREGHRSTAISTPSSGIGLLPNRRPAEPNQIALAYRPRIRMRTADFGPHRRLPWRDIHLTRSRWTRHRYDPMSGCCMLIGRRSPVARPARTASEQTWRISSAAHKSREIDRYDRGS